MRKYLLMNLLLVLLLVPFQVASAQELRDWGTAVEVDPMKEWTVTFTEPVNEKYLQHIYVVDENGKKKETRATVDATNNKVKIVPVTPYEEGQLYTLQVDQKLRSISGSALNEGIIKKFFIEPTQQSEIIYSEEVLVAEGFQYITTTQTASGSIYEFSYADNGTYSKGDLVLIEDIAEYPNGLAGEVIDIKKANGQSTIKLKDAEMDAFFEQIILNEETYLTAEQLGDIDVPGYDVEVRNVFDTSLKVPVGEIKLSPTLKNRSGKFDAEIKFDYILKNLKLNIDFERKKLAQVKHLRVTLSGTQEVRKNVRYGQFFSNDAITQTLPLTGRVIGKKQELKEFQKTFARVPITVSIPGVGGYFETGIIFEAAAAGGARFTSAETTNFEYGAVYKNGKVSKVADSSAKNSETSVVGFGELELKFGVVGKAGINVLQFDILEGSLKGGPYAEFGVYASLTDYGKACFNVESGIFSSVGMTILPDRKWEAGIEFEQKQAFAKPIECEEIERIEAVFTEDALAPGEQHKINVQKVLTNLKDGTKGTEKIKAKKLSFEYDDQFIEINQKEGFVKVKENAKTGKVPVEVVYKDDGDTFTTTFNVNIGTPPKKANITYQLKRYNNRFDYVELQSKTVNVTNLNKQLKQLAIDGNETYNDFLGFRDEGDFFVDADSKVTYDENGYLSLRIYTGNDYIAPRVSSYLIDMENGKRLTVSEVFKTQEQRNQVVAKVKQELRRLGEPSRNSLYKESSLVFDEKWGIAAEKDGYVIVINHEYEWSDAGIDDIYEIVVPFSYSTLIK